MIYSMSRVASDLQYVMTTNRIILMYSEYMYCTVYHHLQYITTLAIFNVRSAELIIVAYVL
jgi:hypothetical protein